MNLAAKNIRKNLLNFLGRVSEIAAFIGTAAASKNTKLFAATDPDIIMFVHQGKCLFLDELH